jgi:hypothetical protein
MDQYLSEGVRAGETLKVTLPILARILREEWINI